MSKASRLTFENRKAIFTDVLPEPDPPEIPPPSAEDPAWPYRPEARQIADALTRTLQHYLAVRAAGSTPTEGGPSFQLADRSIESFSTAAELAAEY